ncbi:MAG: CvpA family protein [Bacteroidales bacterium]|nr:CvpA family protein [Bacteroidales bacterium]
MIIDIIILLLLILAIVMGIRKGFITQVISIVALILGVWLSCRFATLLGNWSAEKLHTSAHLMKFISFAVIFILVSLLLFWVGRLIEKTVKILMLSWLNRLLGVIFSLLKYLIIIGLVLILFDSLNSDFHFLSREYLESSRIYYPLRSAISGVFPYLRDMLTIF